MKIHHLTKATATAALLNIENEKLNFKEKLPGSDYRQPSCRRVALDVRCNPTDDRAEINRLTEKLTDQAHPPLDKTTI